MHISVEVLPLDPRSGQLKKFLLLEPAQTTIQQLFPKIEFKYLQGYVDQSWHNTFAIKTIQDTIGNDLDISYTIGDIFEGQPTPHILRVIQTRSDREQSIQMTSTFRPPDIRPLPSKRFLPPVPLWNEPRNKRRRLDDDAPKAYADLDSDRPIPSCERDVVEEPGNIINDDREADAGEEDVEIEDEERGSERHEHAEARVLHTRITSEERLRRDKRADTTLSHQQPRASSHTSPAVFRKPDRPVSRSRTPAFLRNPYSVDRQTSQSRRFGDRSRVRADVFTIPDSENEVRPQPRRLGTTQPQVDLIASRRVSDSIQDLADPLITPDSTRMQIHTAIAHAQSTAAQVAAVNANNVEQGPTYVQGHRAEPLVTSHATEDDAEPGEEEPFPAFAVEDQAGANLHEQASSSDDEVEDVEDGFVPSENDDRQALRTPFTSFSCLTREPQPKPAKPSSKTFMTKEVRVATGDAHERLQSATHQHSQPALVLDSQPKALARPHWMPLPPPVVNTNMPRNTETRDLRKEHDDRQLAAAKDRQTEQLRKAKAAEAARAANKFPLANPRGDDHMIRSGRPAAEVFDFIHDMPAVSRNRRKSAPKPMTQATEIVKSPPKTIGRAKSVAPKSIAMKTATKASYTGWEKLEASSSQIQPSGTAKRKSEPSKDLSSKKQAKIDFKGKGKAIPQHMLKQDPITVSDTESVQIIGRTQVGNPQKEPVVVINSPANSPPRKATQKAGTKPPNIVPRCLPCKSTHKPCEPDEKDLDGPCKRCLRLGHSCKLTDGTIRTRKPITSSAEGLSSRRGSIPSLPASSFPFPSSQPFAASPTPAPRGKGPAAAQNVQLTTTTMEAHSPSYDDGSPMTNDQLIGAYNRAFSSQASASADLMSSQGSASKPGASSAAIATAPLRTRLVPASSKQASRMITIGNRDYNPSAFEVAPQISSAQKAQLSQYAGTTIVTQRSGNATQPEIGSNPVASLRRSQSSQHKVTPASTQVSAFATQPTTVAPPTKPLQRTDSSQRTATMAAMETPASVAQLANAAPAAVTALPVSQSSQHKAVPPVKQPSAFAAQDMYQMPHGVSKPKSGLRENSSDSQPSQEFHSPSQAKSMSKPASSENSSDCQVSAKFQTTSRAHSIVEAAPLDRASGNQPASRVHSTAELASAERSLHDQPNSTHQPSSSTFQAQIKVKYALPSRGSSSQPAPKVQSTSTESQRPNAKQPTLPIGSSINQAGPGPNPVPQAHTQQKTQGQRNSQVQNSQHQVDGPAYSSDSSSSSESISEGENDFITDVQQTQIDEAPAAKKGSLRKDFIGKLWRNVKNVVALGAGGSQENWYQVPDEES